MAFSTISTPNITQLMDSRKKAIGQATTESPQDLAKVQERFKYEQRLILGFADSVLPLVNEKLDEFFRANPGKPCDSDVIGEISLPDKTYKINVTEFKGEEIGAEDYAKGDWKKKLTDLNIVLSGQGNSSSTDDYPNLRTVFNFQRGNSNIIDLHRVTFDQRISSSSNDVVQLSYIQEPCKGHVAIEEYPEPFNVDTPMIVDRDDKGAWSYLSETAYLARVKGTALEQITNAWPDFVTMISNASPEPNTIASEVPTAAKIAELLPLDFSKRTSYLKIEIDKAKKALIGVNLGVVDPSKGNNRSLLVYIRNLEIELLSTLAGQQDSYSNPTVRKEMSGLYLKHFLRSVGGTEQVWHELDEVQRISVQRVASSLGLTTDDLK